MSNTNQQPDDLVTSWAQYKAFTPHAERFNKAPEDVVTGGDKEPVKVTHGGPGTQAAGGGGSGGGAVGAGNQGPGEGSTQEKEGGTARESDVVDGHPKEFGRYREDLWAKEDEKKRQEESERKEKEKEDDGPIGNEGERRVPSSSDHGFHEWEKQEMEALLGEVRGTLGESFRISLNIHLQVVMYSTRFLEAEDLANNFLFNVSHFQTPASKADNGSRTRSYPFLFSINHFCIPGSV
jgi:phospholipase D1/2